MPLAVDCAGPAAIIGYAVVFQAGAPTHAVAICDTPAGERTVARNEHAALLVAMTREYRGRTVRVARDGSSTE